MSLANGIIIKTKETIKFPFWVELSDLYEDSYELCYWRHCWHIRNDIVAILSEGYTGEASDYPIYLIDIDKIKRILRYYMKKRNWENATRYWSWKEMRGVLFRQYLNLIWLNGYMKKHPDLPVYFYDSY